MKRPHQPTDGPDYFALQELYRDNNRELIMDTLALAGHTDRFIDGVSRGTWSMKKRLIGMKITI